VTKAGKPGIWADILLWWILPAALTFAIVAWFFSDVNWSFVGGLDFSVIYTYRIALLQGLVNTISITSFSLLLGLALGFAFACLLYVPFAPLRWVIVSYIEILRDIPLVVALFWIHFALPFATGISTTAFQSGFIAMALQSSAYLADVVRAGIQAVPRGQWDAAMALGLRRSFVLQHIVMPQALRVIIPPMTSQYLNLIKNSSLAVAVGYQDIVSIANTTLNQTGQAIEAIALIMLVFLTISLGISLFMNWYNARVALVER